MRSLLVTLALLACAVIAEAQQQGKILHVGFLGNAPKERIDAFRGKLRDLGWIEDVTVVIHLRPYPPARTDLWPVIAAEFVHQKVDVIVTVSTAPALAAQKATKTIPIVMAGGADPVEWG